VELDAAVLRRRMCRSFLEEAVSPEALRRALELSTHAPSAGNSQGWAFVVLEGEDTALFWEQQADPGWLSHPSHPGLLNAAAIVLPLGSKARYLERYSEPDKAAPERVGQWQVPYWLVDTAFATMLFLLGLAQEGLGALFFALRRPLEPLLAELGVPEEWEPIGAVALGHPGPENNPPASAGRPRRGLDEVVHRARW
jgi:nitroreductase